MSHNLHLCPQSVPWLAPAFKAPDFNRGLALAVISARKNTAESDMHRCIFHNKAKPLPLDLSCPGQLSKLADLLATLWLLTYVAINRSHNLNVMHDTWKGLLLKYNQAKGMLIKSIYEQWGLLRWDTTLAEPSVLFEWRSSFTLQFVCNCAYRCYQDRLNRSPLAKGIPCIGSSLLAYAAMH